LVSSSVLSPAFFNEIILTLWVRSRPPPPVPQLRCKEVFSLSCQCYPFFRNTHPVLLFSSPMDTFLQALIFLSFRLNSFPLVPTCLIANFLTSEESTRMNKDFPPAHLLSRRYHYCPPCPPVSRGSLRSWRKRVLLSLSRRENEFPPDWSRPFCEGRHTHAVPRFSYPDVWRQRLRLIK